MAPRPAKRQRRATIVLSGSDEDLGTASSKPSTQNLQREITLDGRTSTTVSPVKTTKRKSAPGKTALNPSPRSSPEKARKNSKVKIEAEKSISLHSFFGKATEEQRWRKRSETPDVELENGELSDAIEDDDLSDETLQELGIKTERASATLDRRKPVLSAGGNFKGPADVGGLPSSQRFVKTSAPSRDAGDRADTGIKSVEDSRPWADRYGPSNLEELVVHKKKVADVRNWLQGKIDGRNGQKLLILKGPAGSGKTTTVTLLAQAMRVQLVSWHNPAVSETGANNSIALQFDEFLNRGGQFGSLAFGRDSSTENASKGDSSNRVLVIEEFPASITRSSNTLQSFRSVILRFLARPRNTSSATFRGEQNPNENTPPVVIIISETLLSSSTALSDSFTAHRLLGPEILNHPFVTAVDFNPVAPTFVTKALDIVMNKEARQSCRRRMPGPAVIQRLAEMGDVRSAINSLEFLCLRGGTGSEWSGTIAARKKRTSKDKDSVPMTETEKNSLQLVSQRETTLDMFHAAGKIVYNKREDPRVLDTRAAPPPKPPDHLLHLYTPKASQVDIEALLNETGTDIQTFISTLHENYVLSCNGDTFEDCFDGCSDILSTSDILNPESRPFRRSANSNPNANLVQANLQSGSSDTLRQDEISFHVATRGLLFNLPYPVNRAPPPGGKRGDNFKMFYPAGLRLWKPVEEMEGLVEMFVFGLGNGLGRAGAGFGPQTALVSGADGGVASWSTRTFLEFSTSTPRIKPEPDIDADTTSILNEPGPATRHPKSTLTTEILPFVTRILAARKQDTSVLERITRFKAAAFLSSTIAEDGDEDEEGPVNGSGSTGDGSGLLGRFGAAGAAGAAGAMGQSVPVPHTRAVAGNADADADVNAPSVGKLYISDDDIEDD